jgi:hypothetical protein
MGQGGRHARGVAKSCSKGCGTIPATGIEDWHIEDVASLCAAFGIACTPSSKGSHYKVKHDSLAEMLTVPAPFATKPFYIEALVTFVDLVRGANREASGLSGGDRAAVGEGRRRLHCHGS